MTELEALQTILELGWPAIVMLFVAILWREYRRKTDDQLDDLRAQCATLQREKEMLLGLVLDRAKLEGFDPARRQVPRVSDMYDPDNIRPPTGPLDPANLPTGGD